MRGIKFRAWDKSQRHMSQVTTLDLEMGGCEQYAKNKKFRSIKPLTDVELMQYTGLKDKKGVEIYEGDIVKFAGSKHFEVFWQQGAFCILTNYLTPLHIKQVEDDIIWGEVIGNIYEEEK